MEKKRVEYIKMMYNRKEKNRGFIKKYKDSIGVIASLCAVVVFFTTVITALIQFWNSYQAAEFYHIDQFYFIQESVGNIFYDAIAKMFQVFFPIIAFNLIYRKTKEIQTNQDKKYIVLPCVFFFVYIIVSSNTFSLEAGDILVQAAQFLSNVYKVLIIVFVFLILLSFTSALDDGDKVWCLLLSAFFIFLSVKYKQATENIQEFIASDFSIILFSIYYYVIFMLSKYDEKNNIFLLRFWQVLLSFALIIIMMGLFVMLLQITLGWSTGNRYFKIKKYEIVCKIDNDNLEESKINSELDSVYYDNQQGEKSKFQVVILHRGSQVLLMNGEIDDKTTANLQADMSTSKLWIDTKSYEFQEASQYRFYRKKFKNVTTDKPSNNNQ